MTQNSKKDAIILDIDNTIVYDTYNVHLPLNNTREEWDKFHENKLYYIPELFRINKYIQDLIQRFLYSFEEIPYVIFMTSREDTAQGIIKYNTLRTIKDFFGELNTTYELLMRNENDYRPSSEVKQDLLNKVLEKYNILFAMDDDETNIQMFNNNKITTLKVGGING